LQNSICFANGDLHCGRGTPTINYFVSGTAPNRILVVNFKNVQHYSSSSNLTNAQIQLYEGNTGKIEMHLSNVSSTGYSRTIGIQANNTIDFLTASGLNGTSSMSITNEMIRFESTPICNNTLNLTANQTSICPGTTAVLSSNASPTSNLTFEWYKDNVMLSGHISDTLKVTQGGSYKVKIIDNVAGCQKTSNSVTISNVFSPYLSGGITKCNTLAAYPSGSGYTYKWFKNNVELVGTVTQSITLSDTGSYRAKVTYSGCEISTSSHRVDTNYVSPSPFVVPLTLMNTLHMYHQ
jgi:hypothetical protein